MICRKTLPLFLIVLALGGCQLPDKDFEAALKQAIQPPMDLAGPLWAYCVVYGHWPDTVDELAPVTGQTSLSSTLSKFSQVQLQKKPSGDLLVQYKLAPPSSGSGSFTLTPPSVTGCNMSTTTTRPNLRTPASRAYTR